MEREIERDRDRDREIERERESKKFLLQASVALVVLEEDLSTEGATVALCRGGIGLQRVGSERERR